MKTKYFLSFLLIALCFIFSTTLAQEFTSNSFKVLDPVIQPSEFSASSNFQLWSTVGEVGLGTSTSLSFQLGAGFLRFPFATTPSVSATPGSEQVSLSWSASVGYGGWTASGYNIGQSIVFGGPYTYSSVGNVTSAIQGGLADGITYYFVVVVKDAFGNSIATSTEVSAMPTAPVNNGGGGGGGGGGAITPITTVAFSGRAYPASTVTLLKDAQVVATVVAGSDANFKITTSGISAGNYIFSVYSEDDQGVRSSLLTFPVSVTVGVTTNVSGIFIAPTLSVDKSQVKRGDNIAIFGQSVPVSDIVISINSDQEFFEKKTTDANGVYLLNFDTSPLEMGQHSTKSKSAIAGEISSFSKTVGFLVGTKNISSSPSQNCPAKADLNSDCKVNLVDFSIAAFWYKRSLSSDFKVIEAAKLNGDGKIDLVDFSIMAYYWTG